MDLKAKIKELNDLHEQKALQKLALHEEMKELRRKIAKYENVLKAAEEIEAPQHE